MKLLKLFYHNVNWLAALVVVQPGSDVASLPNVTRNSRSIFSYCITPMLPDLVAQITTATDSDTLSESMVVVGVFVVCCCRIGLIHHGELQDFTAVHRGALILGF